ncbi:MAG: PAC2 family protein [Ilumatobacteraceae bacterium]
MSGPDARQPDHHFVGDVPTLEDPVLVVMLTGWIDASGAAAAAMSALEKECDALPLISFDDDTYIDYRARRPTLELRDGVSTRLVWAAPEVRHGRDGEGRDVLLLSGPEPDMAWHRFAGTVADLAGDLGVTRMAALGAYPFATPHTRPPLLSATSPSGPLLAGLPFRTSSIDLPAGMAAALEQSVHAKGIPALTIWSQVPHYVASMSYPAASVALLDGLTTATGITIGGGELRRESLLQRERLDQLVEGNEEHRAMVAQFERLYDAAEEAAAGEDGTTSAHDGAEVGEIELRSGDELAAEVERFLRDQGGKG